MESIGDFDLFEPASSSLSSEISNSVGLSKNKLRKLRVHEKRIKIRAYKREKERTAQKQNPSRRRRPHQDEKVKLHEKLTAAKNSGPVVVIDCQYEDRMSEKEQRRFAQQLRRTYASNKVASQPFHLRLINLNEDSDFFKICCQMNAGFQNYCLERSQEPLLEVFPEVDYHKLIYLTPEATTPLEGFDPSKVYVIGGLVDETTRKGVTSTFCESKSITTARLPIDEYFTRGDKGTFKSVLTINQVFDIMLKWYETKDWQQAISAGLPSRTGFVPRRTELEL